MKRLTPVVVLGLLTAVCLPSAAAASTRHPNSAYNYGTVTTSPLSGQVAVSPVATDSVTDEPTYLVAGSPDYLVFSRTDTDTSVEPEFDPSTMFVSNASGDVTPLGTQPAGEGFSIAGDLMTSTPSYRGTAVSWLNLSDGTSGSGDMPAGSYYLGATATGWAYVNDNQLFTEDIAGTSTSLGYPLGNASGENVTSGGTGPAGVLVADATSAVAYVPYADPTHPVTLATLNLAAGRDVSTQPAYLQCFAVDSSAFCGISPNTFPDSYDNGERLSLTGGDPVAVPPENGLFYGDAAIDAQATATSNYGELEIFRADGSDPVTDTTFADDDLTSAFGKIAITNKAGTAINTFSASGDTPTQLVGPTPASVEASIDSIGAGRVAYLDDEKSPTTDAPRFVWQRPIKNVDGQIVLGTPDFVGAYVDSDDVSDDFRATGPLLSSATTAVSLQNSNTFNPPTQILRPLRPTELEAGEDHGVGVLSGNRVFNGRGNGVRSTVSGKFVKVVGKKKEIASDFWGSTFCWMAPTGAITCKNIDTGARTAIRKSVSGRNPNEDGSILVYGDHLAWQDYERGGQTTVVDLSHPTRKPVTIPAGVGLDGLTSNGVVENVDSAATHIRTYQLQPYGKGATPITLLTITGPIYQDTYPEVQVDSSVFTWVNEAGVVMAAPLPHVSNPPRYLGDPIAPKSLKAGKTWKAYLPYSAALDACKVVFKPKGGPRVKEHCDPSSMAYGGAVVTWNGRDHAGKLVKAGSKVPWFVVASNADGDALNETGADRDVTGTIRIRK